MHHPLLKRWYYTFCQVAANFHNSRKIDVFWSLVPSNATGINTITQQIRSGGPLG